MVGHLFQNYDTIYVRFLSRILAFYSQVYDHFLTNAHIYAHKKPILYICVTNKFLFSGGPPLNLLYNIFHGCVYPLLTNGTPFTYLAQNFVSLLTAGNLHCHKIGISHKCRTLSRRVRGSTSGRNLPVQIFVKYLSGISGGASPYRPSQGVPSPLAQQEIIIFPDKETYMHASRYSADPGFTEKTIETKIFIQGSVILN